MELVVCGVIVREARTKSLDAVVGCNSYSDASSPARISIYHATTKLDVSILPLHRYLILPLPLSLFLPLPPLLMSLLSPV
jgi:hypothetical protein